MKTKKNELPEVIYLHNDNGTWLQAEVNPAKLTVNGNDIIGEYHLVRKGHVKIEMEEE